MLIRNDAKFLRDYVIKSDNISYKKGNTPLHDAILKKYNIKQFAFLISQIGINKAAIMARMANNKGQLPMDMIDMPEDKEIGIKLNELMLMQNVKPIIELIDEKEILKRYNLDPTQPLYNNLITACSLANEARKIIQNSDTHPQASQYSSLDYKLLKNKIATLRDKILSNTNNCNNEYLEQDAKLIREQHIGNCYEYSVLVLSNLKKISNQLLFGEMYYIKKGDHVFVIIDNDVLSSNRHNKRFSPNAVVCDAWIGDVYPVYEIPLRLTSYSQYEMRNKEFLNTLVMLNSEFHQLARSFSTDNIDHFVIEETTKKASTRNFGLFSNKRKRNDYAKAPPNTKKVKFI